jgi:hypothetical protein
MKILIAVFSMMLIASPALAQVKPCEELKSEIETKIKNNGVTVFTLTIVDKDGQADGKVVGTCGGGAQKIIYKRGVAPSEPSAPSAPPAPPAQQKQ